MSTSRLHDADIVDALDTCVTVDHAELPNGLTHVPPTGAEDGNSNHATQGGLLRGLHKCIQKHRDYVKIPVPDPKTDRLPLEWWKTGVAFIYATFNLVLTTVVITVVHERVPDKETSPPLPDKFFDYIDRVPWAFTVTEINGMVLVGLWFVQWLFLKYRAIAGRRFFFLMGTLYLYRCITMYITTLPVPGKHMTCAPKLYGDSQAKVHRILQLISGGGLSMASSDLMCGDFLYSGHTVMLTLTYLFIKEYSPRSFWWYHLLCWLLSIVGVVCILVAHDHYSVDVVVAYFITSRLFCWYHTMANVQELKTSPHNYLKNTWWSPVFNFFERNVQAPVPCTFCWPIPWPPSCLKNSCRRDALTNRAEVFSDRPDIPIITILTKRRGIVCAPYGTVWRQQRKFCHTALRNFRLSKLSAESCVKELWFVKSELWKLSREGCNVDLTPLISNAVFQRHLLRLLRTPLQPPGPGVPHQAGPHVQGEIRKVETDISSFLRAIIAQHSSTLDPDNPKDLIDLYLVEAARQQERVGGQQTSFSEDYLFYVISDLFVAGTDTTTNTVLWALLYMCTYPQVQEKVQAEIDSVVGSDREPSLEDKASLPFTEATIMEVQRMTAVVPLAIPHMASETTEFRGYTIPKGTVIIPNLWSVHRDPTVWKDPDTFNPCRFLNENGQMLRRECFIPFGIGRRVCMGEQLARMELFLILSGLMQAFTFTLPADQPPPPMHGRFGLTLAPCPYTVRVVPRRARPC
ncbi:hypothetical protein SKAU_G00037840 [Synaphobranchus kaupii]|uniref:Sphingomyelin synthase-like domain-containing protein n=1 Tax=Synaphobranchus kaupii TaxID=118154 RepID=A0A9Q1JDU8_SYNKA|nr:hypothetical protein SKAU_G00037840 [Synaphobranchus kaupii]